jgi:predicted N-acetyltransferase YhbS
VRTTVELIDLPEFGPEDYALIVDGERDPFGTDRLGIEWREKTAHVGLAEAGRLVAHAGWVPARVTAASGQAVEVLGLGSVLVHRSFRGSGVGLRLVGGAMERMRDLGGPVGMLFCRPQRLAFYRGLGWTRTTSTVTVDQPGGVITMPLETCWVTLSAGAAWPETDVHVEGLPF